MPNSPAADAQIQRGDVIQKFDGHEVRNITELRRLVSQAELDKKVDVQVARNGKPVTLSAKIKEEPANYRLARALPPGCAGQQAPPSPNEPDADEPEQPDGSGVLDSIEVRELTPATSAALGVPGDVRGVVVAQVGSEIGGGQLRAGDGDRAINQRTRQLSAGLPTGDSVARPEPAPGPLGLPAT